MPDELDKYLDTYDRKQEERQRAQTEKRQQEDAFLAQFTEFRRSVAKPVFEEIGAHLRKRGHDFEILEQEHTVDHNGRTSDARIEFRFYPKGMDRSMLRAHEGPSFTVIVSRTEKSLALHGSTITEGGGMAGGRGNFTLETLTSERLRQELVKLVGEVLSK